MVYGTQITIVTGAFVNQLITEGAHIFSSILNMVTDYTHAIINQWLGVSHQGVIVPKSAVPTP